MWSHLLLSNLFVASVFAFAPATIRWGGSASDRFILMPAPRSFLRLAAKWPQELTIRDPSHHDRSVGEVPQFIAKPDDTITWEAKDLCIEASGTERGNVVRLNHCTGGPTQKWNWFPWGPMKLKGTNQCVDALVDNGGALDGAPVVLQNCQDSASESWEFEPPGKQHIDIQGPQHASMLFSLAILSWSGLSIALLLSMGDKLRNMGARARPHSFASDAHVAAVMAVQPDPITNGDALPQTGGPKASRRAFLGGAAAVAVSPLPSSVSAWCGDPLPQWAYYLKWDENRVPFKLDGGVTGEVFYRIVGDPAREQKLGAPPVLMVGTPGLGYEYLENFEPLTVSDRRVILVTFVGSGSAEGNPALQTADACAVQLRAVCDAAKLNEVHVVAHGLGAVAALRFARKSGVTVRSLTLISPYGAPADLKPDAQPKSDGDMTRLPTPADLTSDGQSVGGMSRVAQIRPLLTLMPTSNPDAKLTCISEAAAAGDPPLASGLLSLAPPTQALGAAGLAQQIQGLSCPLLVVDGGSKDLIQVDWTDLPNSTRRLTYSEGGHLPFVEKSREKLLSDLLQFMDDADGVQSNRELKFSPVEELKNIRTPASG